MTVRQVAYRKADRYIFRPDEPVFRSKALAKEGSVDNMTLNTDADKQANGRESTHAENPVGYTRRLQSFSGEPQPSAVSRA